MKVKFVSTTHPIGNVLEGVECDLTIGITAFFTFNPYKNEIVLDDEGRYVSGGEFHDFELRRGQWITSRIQSMDINEKERDFYIITIKTRNSEYVFSKGKNTGKLPLTDDEILESQIALGMYLF